MATCINNNIVKTRKDHICWLCGSLILKGEVCTTQTNTDEGRIYTIYMHNDCENKAHESNYDCFYHSEYEFRTELLGLEK